MRALLSIAFAILVILPNLSVAQDTAFKDLIASKSLVCEFPLGIMANWNGNILKLENDKMSNAINFDSIDSEAKKARMIANAGAGDVIVLTTPSGLTFIESTDYGNAIYITVFPAYLDQKILPNAPKHDLLISSQLSKAFLAVMSRHLFDPISHLPMPSQFQGYCRKLQ